MKYITERVAGASVDFSMEDSSFIVKDSVSADFLLNPENIKLPDFYKKLCEGAKIPLATYEKNFKDTVELYVENAPRLQEYLNKGEDVRFDVEHYPDGKICFRNDNMMFKPVGTIKWPAKILEYNKMGIMFARDIFLGTSGDKLGEKVAKDLAKKVTEDLHE